MSYSQSAAFGSAVRLAERPQVAGPIEVLVRRLRQAIGIAAVLLLVVFAAQAERSAPEASPDASVIENAAPTEAVYDGRGKWGGYAR